MKDGVLGSPPREPAEKGKETEMVTLKVRGELELFQKQRWERILSEEELRAMSSAASNSRIKKTEKKSLYLAIGKPLVTSGRGISYRAEGRKHFFE